MENTTVKHMEIGQHLWTNV